MTPGPTPCTRIPTTQGMRSCDRWAVRGWVRTFTIGRVTTSAAAHRAAAARGSRTQESSPTARVLAPLTNDGQLRWLDRRKVIHPATAAPQRGLGPLGTRRTKPLWQLGVTCRPEFLSCVDFATHRRSTSTKRSTCYALARREQRSREPRDGYPVLTSAAGWATTEPCASCCRRRRLAPDQGRPRSPTTYAGARSCARRPATCR